MKGRRREREKEMRRRCGEREGKVWRDRERKIWKKRERDVGKEREREMGGKVSFDPTGSSVNVPGQFVMSQSWQQKSKLSEEK